MAAPAPVLGSVIQNNATSDTQRLINLVVDNFEANTISGIRINGGSRFDDTLGGFYPVVINPSGEFTINSSFANFAGIRFHNTATALTDSLVRYSDTGALFFFPDSATTSPIDLVVSDRYDSTYLGWIIKPAFTSGTTHPMLQTSDPPGTANTVFFNGRFFGSLNTDGVNYLLIQGAAAGSEPGIAAFGTDTDIDITLQTKGAGVVDFNYANTALGGGAAATLGTIGGSGPTTAGQNSWLKIEVFGNAVWLPIWT